MSDSRKRGSERQITKDDDERDADVAEPVTNSFDKAGQDVIAARRIVRARRPAAGVSEPRPASEKKRVNPFANVHLVAPGPAPANISANAQDGEESKIMDKDNAPEEAKVLEEPESPAADEVTSPAEIKDVKKQDEAPTEEKVVKSTVPAAHEKPATADDSKKEVVGETPPVFGGFAGFTGFATSSFSFPATAGLNTSGFGGFGSVGSGGFGSIGSGGFGSIGSGGLNFGTGFGSTASSNGSFPVASGFGSNGIGAEGVESESASIQAPTTAIVSLSEVTVETGEEFEVSVFNANATLFEFEDSKWKGRGSGEVKLNVPKDSSSKKRTRLVMRAKGSLRLLMNAVLLPDLQLSIMDGRGVSFAVVNAASETNTLANYALRFKSNETAKSFINVVNEKKGGEEKDDDGGAPSVNAGEANDEGAGESHHADVGESAGVQEGAAENEVPVEEGQGESPGEKV